MKQITVTFSYDPDTDTVSNVQTSVDGVEKKKRTTKKAKKDDELLAEESVITLEANKLCFNNKAVAEMELTPEDRIVIKYEKFGDLQLQEGSENKTIKDEITQNRSKPFLSRNLYYQFLNIEK